MAVKLNQSKKKLSSKSASSAFMSAMLLSIPGQLLSLISVHFHYKKIVNNVLEPVTRFRYETR